MLLINILPFGGLGIWTPARSKKRKKMSGVGGIGAAGGGAAVGGVSSSGGAAASVAATPADGASASGAEAPGQVGSTSGKTDNAEKFGFSQNVNMSQHTSVTNNNMCTQDHLSLRSMSQSGGAQDSPAVDMKKLIEMMIMLKLLQAMQQQG